MTPTPFAELNAVLADFSGRLQATLGDALVGLYLQGSFAHGGGDLSSDVDWIAVTARSLTDADEAALNALHAALFAGDSPWARRLDGSYIPQDALRRTAPGRPPLHYLDNGSRTLVRSAHDDTQVVRWVLREHGVTLFGPSPQTLIAPVGADDLRAEVRAVMDEWGAALIADPTPMDNRWYQPFVVLSYCRMLQTLETGRIGSKPDALRWARATLEPRWHGLIARAWESRGDAAALIHEAADPYDLRATVAFIDAARSRDRAP